MVELLVAYLGQQSTAACHGPCVPFSARLNIRVFGSFLPHAILGRFRVVCSILRMLYLILAAIFTGHMGYDLVFNDQVAVVNPLLRLIGRKVIFYGHFPDLLLADRGPSLLRRLYRYPFDKLESLTTGMCDMVLVNSKFTAETFCQTFPSFRKAKPRVLYPPVSTEVEAFQQRGGSDNSDATFSELEGFDLSVPFATSLNRFEEKKNVELAIRAVASLPRRIKCNLIVAGGFDPRLPECNKYLQRLVKLSKELNFCVHGCDDGVDANASVTHNSEGRCILFLKNVKCSLKLFLLKRSVCILYTPHEEHFGIVPCEAMFLGTLPVACNTGGPRETIVNGGTNPEELAVKVLKCSSLQRSLLASMTPDHTYRYTPTGRSLRLRKCPQAMRSKAQAHAAKCFSPDVFRRSLQAVIEDVTGNWDDNSLGHLKKG